MDTVDQKAERVLGALEDHSMGLMYEVLRKGLARRVAGPWLERDRMDSSWPIFQRKDLIGRALATVWAVGSQNPVWYWRLDANGTRGTRVGSREDAIGEAEKALRSQGWGLA